MLQESGQTVVAKEDTCTRDWGKASGSCRTPQETEWMRHGVSARTGAAGEAAGEEVKLGGCQLGALVLLLKPGG